VLRDRHGSVFWPDDLADGRELDWVRLAKNSPDFALMVTVLLDNLRSDEHAPLCYQFLRQLAYLTCFINLDGL